MPQFTKLAFPQGDALANALDNITPGELLEALHQLQVLSRKQPDTVINMLNENPTLAAAVLRCFTAVMSAGGTPLSAEAARNITSRDAVSAWPGDGTVGSDKAVPDAIAELQQWALTDPVRLQQMVEMSDEDIALCPPEERLQIRRIRQCFYDLQKQSAEVNAPAPVPEPYTRPAVAAIPEPTADEGANIGIEDEDDEDDLGL